MHTSAEKSKESQTGIISQPASHRSKRKGTTIQLIDNRQESLRLKSLQDMADNRSREFPAFSTQRKRDDLRPTGDTAVGQLMIEPEPLQRQGDLEEEELLQSKFDPLQRQGELDEEELLQGKFDPVQRQGDLDEEELLQGKFDRTEAPDQLNGETGQRKNNSGLPDNLKQGIENLSGTSMDGVKVHYNSPKPAQLQALAYTQGRDIHVAPGQEKYLPHEAWHVVQQRQGRVRPTTQANDVAINDDESLEREADVMGAKASDLDSSSEHGRAKSKTLQGRFALSQLRTADSYQFSPVVQKGKTLDAIKAKLKKWASVKSIGLTLEGIGHVAAGIVILVAGGAAMASLVGTAPGVAAIVAGVGQILIGVSKFVRAVILAGNPELTSGQKKFLGFLVAFEGSIGVATAVATAGLVALIMGSIGGLIKLLRGILGGGEWISPKIQGALVFLESLLGIGSFLGTAISKGAVAVSGIISTIVNYVKEFRGGMTATAETPAASQRVEPEEES